MLQHHKRRTRPDLPKRRQHVLGTREINMADSTDNSTASKKYGRFSAPVILKADGTNYVSWASNMEALIRAEKADYWTIITNEGTAPENIEPGEEFIM